VPAAAAPEPAPASVAPVIRAPDDRLDRLLDRARSRLRRLEPGEAWAAVQAGHACVVDIRPEFQRRADGEIPGAIVIERNHLEWRLDPVGAARIPEAGDPALRWIVVCDEGYASSLAAATLQLIGLDQATDIAGGFQAWREAGLPLTHPTSPSPPRLAPSPGS
jgi:rhodanese-related sulfurtransferase